MSGTLPTNWDEARRLFVEEGYTVREVSDRLGIPFGTLGKRVTRDSWRKEREDYAEYGTTLRTLRSQLAKQALAKVRDNANPAPYLDALAKADRIGRQGTVLDPRVRRDAGLEMMELIIATLREKEPAAAAALGKHLEHVATVWEAACGG